MRPSPIRRATPLGRTDRTDSKRPVGRTAAVFCHERTLRAGMGALGTPALPGSVCRCLRRIGLRPHGRVRSRKRSTAAVELWELSAREAFGRDTLRSTPTVATATCWRSLPGRSARTAPRDTKGGAAQGRDAIMARFGGCAAAAQAQEEAAKKRDLGGARRIVATTSPKSGSSRSGRTRRWWRAISP